MEFIATSRFRKVYPECQETSVYLETYQFTAHELASLVLNQRQLCDLELILNGGFAPLNGFMNKADYEEVLAHMHLRDGTLWPMPITLDVDSAFAQNIKSGQEVALRDAEGLLLAILQVGDIWKVDRQTEAQAIFGTTDDSHPGVSYLVHQVQDFYVGGRLLGISLPHHYDFHYLRYTPAELKEIFQQRGW